jgi:hypothetical protein
LRGESASFRAGYTQDLLIQGRTLLQIILLLLYIPQAAQPGSKKRKRNRRKEGSTAVETPTDDPQAALDLMMDRLVVWQAVADLGLDLAEDAATSKSKERASEGGISVVLRQFWEEVIVHQ